MTNAMMIPNNAPSYQCYSTDVVGGKVDNAKYKGADLYLIDVCRWYRVLDDLTLAPLVYNISSGISGSASGSDIGTAGGISLGASEAHIGQTGSNGTITTGSFQGVGTATLHNANTHVAPATGGVFIIPNVFRTNGGTGYIFDMTLTTSASGVVIAPRIHFFSASSVTVSADSGSWISLFADDASDLGYYTLPAMTSPSGSSTNCSRSSLTDTSTETHPCIFVKNNENNKNLYAALETRTSFTSSASALWRLKLSVNQC